jgi:hypothetical protein
MKAPRDIIREKRRNKNTMRSSRLVGAVAAILAFLALCSNAPAQNPWLQPASDLAAQIAVIFSHGTARLMIRNLSSLPVDEIPAIRKRLEQDLRARGIVAGSAPNDTIIRVTLSEDRLDGLWVAEVIRGDDTQVAIVRAGLPFKLPAENRQISLRAEHFWEDSDYHVSPIRAMVNADPILAASETKMVKVVVESSALSVYTQGFAGWSLIKAAELNIPGASQRDPHSLVIQTEDGEGFSAFAPGIRCTGNPTQPTSSAPKPSDYWTIDCHSSDDPWPLAPMSDPATPLSGADPNPSANPPPSAQTAPTRPQIYAFYNPARNYFTGVVSPGVGVNLPPFYSAAVLQRASGTALLIGGIDGKVLLAASGRLTTVSGTSDWGSDFAQFQSGCGDGSQIIVSSNEDSDTDSLRAFQITGSEATPLSAPLQIDGTVTAVQSAPDGKSIFAVIRNPQNQYEVDRVTALCN